MAAIAQANLFSWDALEARSDLDRFFLVRDHLPDERLVHYLEVMRGNGRDDFRHYVAAAHTAKSAS
jgi:tRNA isopentenyl-2-thiomethyl-A-37 hydroxylase MiaE